jgi:Beta xylosidase C-terminal Concanavalin A-like domain
MSKNRLKALALVIPPLAVVLASNSVEAATPAPAPPGPPLSSSFAGPCWTVSAPVGGTASSSNGHLFLNVPGGSNHDTVLPSDQAVRVMQPIGKSNFDVAIKIDSAVQATDAGTNRGLMVFSDAKDFITFGIMADGTNIHLIVQTVASGAATKVLDEGDFTQYQNPIYLRITRNSSAYVAYYSIDGTSWVQAASFVNAKTPTSIGPFASNYNQAPVNAVPVVMAVNWFTVQ